MLVANSFDLWQKDAFFSAAEEVQQSADIMESSYRTWVRARREGCKEEELDELSRELQMALGTAKWQLEEFERAVCMSYRSHRDDITVSRHSQFVSALEDQISRVETALKESFQVEGKKAFHWVNLDEEECDDLAIFLSGNSGTSQRITDEAVGTSLLNKKSIRKEHSNLGSEDSSTIQILNEVKSPQEVVSTNEDINCFVETGNGISFQADKTASNRRSALEIVIVKDDRQNTAEVEATPKEKGTKPFFWNARGEDRHVDKGVLLSHPQLNVLSWINQRLRGYHRNQRQQQMSQMLPVNSIRFVLALLLTIFLVVPFLLFST
ncbi:hypothetical protein C2S51_002187 [Perilla frutescens var. frutescens]|nr:hypothetical protein C2S51_002187 [Perilla frutescens var. frutescens]